VHNQEEVGYGSVWPSGSTCFLFKKLFKIIFLYFFDRFNVLM
jgi:hypothetical protein